MSEKIYRVKLNSSGMPNFSTAVEVADRPQREWIEHERAEEVNGMLISNYECSYCHEWERKASDYCPNCGCRMKGADDD